MTERFNWVDNPTVAQVSEYNPDILNECLMHLKYNNIPSNTKIFSFNSGNVDANGNADLIDVQLSTELVYTQPGVYSVTVSESGYYDVVVIGGGAGGAWGMNVYSIRSSSSGGSGAGFAGRIYIPAGTYTCTVGAGGAAAGNGGYGGGGGATSIGNIISAGGGAQGAYATWENRVQSTGGVISVQAETDYSTLNSNGNNGTVTFNSNSAGGASLYNGFGRGGDASCYGASNGANGYLSIKLQGQSYINYKIGGAYPELKGTMPDGEQFTITGLNSDDAVYLSNGTYNKFVGADGSSELLKNDIFIQSLSPSANTGDVWFNTSFEPCSLLKWNGSQWDVYNKIPMCKFTVNNGAISSFQTFPYNQNGYTPTMRSPLGKPSGKYVDLTFPSSGGTVIAPYNGYIQLSSLACNSMDLCNNTRGNYRNSVSNQNGGISSVTVPCQKGDEIQVYYNLSSVSWFRCYADEGAI